MKGRRYFNQDGSKDPSEEAVFELGMPCLDSCVSRCQNGFIVLPYLCLQFSGPRTFYAGELEHCAL